jgi:hypothetical protein
LIELEAFAVECDLHERTWPVRATRRAGVIS